MEDDDRGRKQGAMSGGGSSYKSAYDTSEGSRSYSGGRAQAVPASSSGCVTVLFCFVLFFNHIPRAFPL